MIEIDLRIHSRLTHSGYMSEKAPPVVTRVRVAIQRRLRRIGAEI